VALVVEDGTGKTDSNSYCGLADARAYALDREVTLPASDAVLSPMLVKATDFIESYEARFPGMRMSELQALAWPRKSATIYGYPIAENAIHAQLKKATYEAVIALYLGVDLQPTGQNAKSFAAVRKEKVGPLEQEYAIDSGSYYPVLVAVDNAIAPLLMGGGGITTARA
jgi:hypothetical protein